jgi:hypothetical protein
VASRPCRQRHPCPTRCAAPCRSTRVVEGLAWDCTPAPSLGTLLTRVNGPGRRYTGVCGATTGSPFLHVRGVSRCRSAHPTTVICITVVVLGGIAFVALICRGARTCVSVFYPNGQSVRVCKGASSIMWESVQSFYLKKLMLFCRLRLLYAGLYAILARCSYYALPIFQGVVHRTLTTLLARCTYCALPI